MKKLIGLLVLLLIASAGIGYYLFRPVYGLDRYILTADGKPQPALVELLKLEGLSHDNSLDSIIAATQPVWLRKAGCERYQVQGELADRKEFYKELFIKLGLVKSIYPMSRDYDYACIYGSVLLSVRLRIACLIDLWKQGIRFKQIVFLVGERLLYPEVESLAALCDTTQTILPIRKDWQYDQNTMQYKTEGDMQRLVYDQAEKPEGFAKIPTVFIDDAPGYQNSDGTWRRADTKSTIKQWLAKKPQPGKILAVTHQPYVCYQDAISHTYIPDTYTIETVGFAIPEEYESVAVKLDSLARWLYQERLRRERVAKQGKPDIETAS
jgi:hypothetical protein